MLVIFDEGTPLPIRLFLVGHTVETAAQRVGTSSRMADCSRPLRRLVLRCWLLPTRIFVTSKI